MIKEIRILFMMMCATALALGSCAKHSIEPEPEQPELIGFSPVSETAQVKSTTPLYNHHADFGVWGIAHEPLNDPYFLWEDNDLTQVRQSTSDDNVYIPVRDAYWFKGYTYNFIAVAPFTNSGISNTSVNSNNNTLIFTYNIADKYALKGAEDENPKDDYEFDLMAAVAQTGPFETTMSSTQNLTFLHLFSQININVLFANLGEDNEGNAITGSVSQMRLYNIDSEADYTITNDVNNLVVTCQTDQESSQQAISFTGNSACINVLPQDITDFEFYIDFMIGDVAYYDYKVNLNIQDSETNPNGTNPSVYRYNGKYNWNLTIGPKAAISFKVTVDPWGSLYVNNEDIEII